MERSSVFPVALVCLACSGNPAPGSVSPCIAPEVTAASWQPQTMLHGAVQLELPRAYFRAKSKVTPTRETWMTVDRSALTFWRMRVRDARIDSLPGAAYCREELAGRTVHFRRWVGGDYVRVYWFTAAWEAAPDDWVWVAGVATGADAHREQLAAVHTLRR